MCTVSINIDENELRGYNPQLVGSAAISQWVQELVDARLKEMKAIQNQEFVEVDIDSL
jgi:hypothetical protein